jgi:hypothetical protein
MDERQDAKAAKEGGSEERRFATNGARMNTDEE